MQHLGSVTGSDWLTQRFPQGAVVLEIVEGKLMAGLFRQRFFASRQVRYKEWRGGGRKESLADDFLVRFQGAAAAWSQA